MADLVASEVLQRVRTILQDAGSRRWLLSELSDWLNDALLDICFHKPDACSSLDTLSLDSGTKQTLPSGTVQLIRVIRNGSGRVVTPIAREILDNQIPGWHDTSVVPYSATVAHVAYDDMDLEHFWVFPGNDGTGEIEAVVAKEPTKISKPSNPEDLAGYTGTLDISPVYQSAVIDFILYRAFSKDMQFAGAAERAMAHYQNYLRQLGVRDQVEAMANVNTTQSQPNS